MCLLKLFFFLSLLRCLLIISLHFIKLEFKWILKWWLEDWYRDILLTEMTGSLKQTLTCFQPHCVQFKSEMRTLPSLAFVVSGTICRYFILHWQSFAGICTFLVIWSYGHPTCLSVKKIFRKQIIHTHCLQCDKNSFSSSELQTIRDGQVPSSKRDCPALLVRHLLRGVPHSVHVGVPGPHWDLGRLHEAQDRPGKGGVPVAAAFHPGLRDQEQSGPQMHREGREVPRGGKQTVPGGKNILKIFENILKTS